MDPLNFDVTLGSAAGGGIKIPYDVRALFGKAKPPVVATVRAGREHGYRSTVAMYGGEYYLPLNKANATAAAITAGEPFSVTVTPDDQPRAVMLPADLAAAIDGAGSANVGTACPTATSARTSRPSRAPRSRRPGSAAFRE